jgi:hypothetical protein
LQLKVSLRRNVNGNESENLSQAFVDVVKWYLIVEAQSAHVRSNIIVDYGTDVIASGWWIAILSQ